MPDGETHLKIWKQGIVGSAIASLIIQLGTKDPALTIGFIAGYLLGRYVTPDADLIGITSEEGRLMRELKFFGVLITMWFLPYAYLMRFVGIGRKGHRNFFSHFPFVSTAIRLAWLLLPALIASYLLVPDLLSYAPEMFLPTFSVFMGLSLADTHHYLADRVTERRRNVKWN